MTNMIHVQKAALNKIQSCCWNLDVPIFHGSITYLKLIVRLYRLPSILCIFNAVESSFFLGLRQEWYERCQILTFPPWQAPLAGILTLLSLHCNQPQRISVEQWKGFWWAVGKYTHHLIKCFMFSHQFFTTSMEPYWRYIAKYLLMQHHPQLWYRYDWIIRAVLCP